MRHETAVSSRPNTIRRNYAGQQPARLADVQILERLLTLNLERVKRE